MFLSSGLVFDGVPGWWRMLMEKICIVIISDISMRASVRYTVILGRLSMCLWRNKPDGRIHMHVNEHALYTLLSLFIHQNPQSISC
jgi:hypothetical protein